MNDIADLHGQFPFSDQVLRFFSHLHLFGHIQLGAYDLYFPAMLGGEPHSAFVVSVLIFRFVENPYGNLSLRDFFIYAPAGKTGRPAKRYPADAASVAVASLSCRRKRWVVRATFQMPVCVHRTPG